MGFDTEDGLTVLLTDSEDDWWINGNEPPSDVPSLLRAWRRFQTLVSHLSESFSAWDDLFSRSQFYLGLRPPRMRDSTTTTSR